MTVTSCLRRFILRFAFEWLRRPLRSLLRLFRMISAPLLTQPCSPGSTFPAYLQEASYCVRPSCSFAMSLSGKSYGSGRLRKDKLRRRYCTFSIQSIGLHLLLLDDWIVALNTFVRIQCSFLPTCRPRIDYRWDT